MQVNLMGKYPMSHELCGFEPDSIKKDLNQPFFDDLSADFIKIQENLISQKNFETVEEGDFYLNRMWFYAGVGEFEKSVDDANYLRDSASYSRYSERGDYYNNWALYSLFNVHIIQRNSDKALESIDAMLDKKRSQEPIIYYSVHGGFLSYQNKLELFECFGKQDELISYLKNACRENFDWYFERAKYKYKKHGSGSLGEYEYYTSKESFEYYLGSAKHKSFHLLKLLVDYMDQYDHPELKKYQNIFDEIRFQVNENYETIDPEMKDRKLKFLVSGVS